MRLIVLYLSTKYEICTWNSLQYMTSSLVFTHFGANLTLTFEFDLWPWTSVKVIGTWVIECVFMGCTLVPSMKSVGEITSEIWPDVKFLHFFWKLWPWPMTLNFGQGHRHLGHWMRLIVLYLSTKYEVCKWNSLQDITSSLFFYTFWENLTLTFDLELRSRSSALGSLNAPYWVVSWYQVWSLWV